MDFLSKQLGKEIHFKDYWVILKDNMWLIISCCVIIVSVVAITSFSKTPLYDARSTVLIKPQPTRPISSVEEIEPVGINAFGPFWARSYFNTQYEIIKGRKIADYVIERFNLTEHEHFKHLSKKHLAKVIMSKVDVIPKEGTNIVQIKVIDPDPKIAAFLANAVAEVYMWYNLESALEKTRDAYQMLQDKLDSLRGRVSESQKSLFDLAEAEKLYIPEDISSLNSTRMGRLNEAYITVRTDRIDSEILLKQIQEVKRNNGSYLEIKEVGENPVVATLYSQYINMEVNLNSLKMQFKSKHPEVQKHLDAMKNLKKRIDEEIERILNRIKRDYAAQKEKEEIYLQALNEVKEESINLSKKKSRYDLAQQQSAYAKDSYQLIQDKIKQTDLLQGLRDNNVSILERAEPPARPFSPKYAMNLTLSFIVSLLFGVSLVFLKEYLDTNVKTPEDIEDHLQLPILSMVPHTAEGVSKSSVREAFNSLRTALHFTQDKKGNRCVLVTSSIPKEGKTSIAVNLGKTLSQAGDRVLLLDCDFRRPMLHNHFNIDRRNGISNYIVQHEQDDWRGIINKMSKNLHVATCGPIPPDPPKLISHDKFRRMIEGMRREYDWVIVDSPPVTGITDPVILSAYCDGSVLVVRRNAVDREIARRAVRSLSEANRSIIGAVFNDVDFQSAYYTRYYKYGYYYYYKKSEEPESELLGKKKGKKGKRV